MNKLIMIIGSSMLIGYTIPRQVITPPVQVQLTLPQAQALTLKTWGLAGRMAPLSIPTVTWRPLYCVGLQEVYPDTINPLGFGPIPVANAGKPIVQLPDGKPEIHWKGCGSSYTAAFIDAKIPVQ